MPGAPARDLSAVPQSQAGLMDVCVLRHAIRCNEERPQYGHTDVSPLALRHCVHVPREAMLGMSYFFVERFGPNACLVAGHSKKLGRNAANRRRGEGSPAQHGLVPPSTRKTGLNCLTIRGLRVAR